MKREKPFWESRTFWAAVLTVALSFARTLDAKGQYAGIIDQVQAVLIATGLWTARTSTTPVRRKKKETGDDA